MTVYIKKNATVIVRAKNYQHAINLFANKVGYDLEYAILNDGYTIEIEEN